MSSPRRLILPDGRGLAWRESGPPDGRLVLHFHGSASSSLEPAPGSEALDRLGVRLVQPDRPGYGHSDPCPGRRLADWAADCRELLEHLGAERAAVSGWSAGALHALGCVAHDPSSFTAAALVAVPGPLGEPENLARLPADCRAAARLARWAPALVQSAFAAVAPLLRARPGLSLDWFERLLPEPDRVPLREEALRERWLAMVREAWRQGAAGSWHEGLLLLDDWDFDPGAVRVPVRLWHGTADRLTPLAMGEDVAARVPGACLHRLEGEGHAAWLSHGEEILADLLSAAGEG